MAANPSKQAVALLAGGDKAYFHMCGFVGFQDTLCDERGRHYFHSCYIEGAIDFIFGYGQSIYEVRNTILLCFTIILRKVGTSLDKYDRDII